MAKAIRGFCSQNLELHLYQLNVNWLWDGDGRIPTPNLVRADLPDPLERTYSVQLNFVPIKILFVLRKLAESFCPTPIYPAP
jgi:hypothetical protein